MATAKRGAKKPARGSGKRPKKCAASTGRKGSKRRATSGPLKKEQRKAALTKTKAPVKKKQPRRTYTDEELSVPKLNKITPVGVQKPSGKKKGKVFVDDPESMMTILAMVSAEKEGQIESQMVKARQMEDIRDARRREQEKKEETRKEKLEETKDSLRKKRRRKRPGDVSEAVADAVSGEIEPAAKKKKRVSFA